MIIPTPVLSELESPVDPRQLVSTLGPSDRQIVAIAKVVRATAIYSDDKDIRSIAAMEDISVIGLADLPLPAEDLQGEFVFEPLDAEVSETGDATGSQ